MKKTFSFLLVMAVCLLAATTSVHAAGLLKIHMLSALDGRADCFVIELPDNTKMVVDCPEGWDTTLINKLNALGFGGGIKYLCGTHEHVDHIGGMNNFINSGFPINNTQIYYPKGAINADGVHYNNLVSACNGKGLTIKKLVAGDYIVNTTYNGLAFKVRCLSPENYRVDGGADDWGSENEASLVLKITYGSKSILMQGDGYGSTELDILAGPYAGEINACQVLKVGHHGVNANGALSCREAYLDAAGVNKALITDGDMAIDQTIKDRLQARGIRYWSSGDGDGYAWLSTDGASNWVESEDPLWPVTSAITTQPASQTVNPGSSVTFTVSASGTAPLTYQWRFNGVNISGATAASLTKSNVQNGDAGNYSVVVNNIGGSATSANAVLSVNVPPSITTQPASQTVNPGANVTFTVVAAGTAPLSYQWTFNGANISGATTSSFTKSNVQSGDAGNYAVVVSNVAGSATSANAALSVNVPPSITTQPSSQTVNPGANVTFTVTASGTAPLTYQWTFNGANISGATTSSFTKSNVQSGDAGNYAVVVGNVAGSATSANAALTVNVPPSITTQPSNQTVNPGANVTFTVTASGTAPLTYQWTFNGANISGATTSSFTKSNVQSGDAGNYAVVVANIAGSATSVNAALTVNVPPSITTQPSSQTVNPGANVTFTVTASGTAPLTYQWTFNGANISGATTSSFTKSNVQSSDAGNYAAVVSNIAGSATSANAALSVNVPPSITTQPSSQTVNPGANVTFTVVASGTAPLNYQWTFNGANISGATTSSFTKNNVQSGDAGNYAVVVTNVAGSATSANAALTVNVPPSITTQPSSQTVNSGANVTFTVVAAGTAPLSYQWRVNGVNISGATSASYTKNNAQSSDAGNYAVVVTNVAGSITSANALLTVTTTIVSDTYNVTTSGTGFGLNAGVNTGINPPTTRLTGSTISNLRYFQTVTTRPASSYDINGSRLRVTTGNTIGRFTLSANGTAPFDFGPALGTSSATPANPVVYDVKIGMRNDATGNPRFSLGLATVEGDINNMDFALQMYRANTADTFYTIQKRIDRGSFNGTTSTDATGDVNATMVTAQANTAATMMDFLIRVTDAGSESGSSYNSRIQVSTNAGSSWIYDTASDSAILNRFRFDGTGRYFAFDQAPNTTGNIFYNAFSVTTRNTAPPQSLPAPMVNNFETWKASYGITDSNADNDGDGQSNYAEYIANTDPTSATSYLKIINATSQNGHVTVSWSSVGGTRYRLQQADGPGAEFTDIVRNAADETDPGMHGKASTQSFTDTSTSSNEVRFYRIKVVE